MNIPEKKTDLQWLIDNQVQENIHLDYKDSRALSKSNISEICKDVSAFANSDGGMIIYGIREDENGHFPKNIDAGVDNKIINKEWLENSINSNINPKIEGVIIKQISVSDEASAFVVSIPKSYRAPHQEGSKRVYYKRYNFKSAPMEHYEILDIQNRKSMILPFVSVVIKNKGGIIFLEVENIGGLPVTDVSFELSSDMVWCEHPGKPLLFEKGTNALYSGRKFVFIYNYYSSLKSKIIDISVSYIHPQNNARVSDRFFYDLQDFSHSITEKSDVEEIGEKINSTLQDMSKKLEKIESHMDSLKKISTPTGLNISVTALRNIKRMMENENGFEKINPDFCSPKLFEEVLGVDSKMSHQLYTYFSFYNFQSAKKLEEIEDISDDLLLKMKLCFDIKDG